MGEESRSPRQGRVREWLFPENSRRGLAAFLLLQAMSSPGAFARKLTWRNLRDFFYYLRRISPQLIKESIERSFESPPEAPVVNDYFLTLLDPPPAASAPLPRSRVDIILPVHDGYDYVVACVESIFAGSENFRLIIVDDASSDGRVSAYLAGVRGATPAGDPVIVLTNGTNLGFVRSVNRAHELVAGHFVILNSDTEVPPGWLERLLAPLVADPLVATVTPFANAATICSFPDIGRDNPPFRNLPVAEIDGYFRRFGGEEPVEIPTGVGFCLAVNGEAVSRVGLFDEATFGRGYGEENDFCMRATRAGYRHVIVPDLFVYHKHGGSFGEGEKDLLLTENMAKLKERHPDFLLLVEEFTVRDPLRSIRESLAVLMDAGARGGERLVAILDHDLGGGANLYAASFRADCRARGLSCLTLAYSFRDKTVKLRYESGHLEKEFALPCTAAARLDEILRILRVDFVVVNELASWPEPLAVGRRLLDSGIPYLVLLHDYFWICPNWFLVNGDCSFCGVPSAGRGCAACLADNPFGEHPYIYPERIDLGGWRETMGAIITGAARVVSFSTASAELLQQVYPGLGNVTVIEHAIPSPELFSRRRREPPEEPPLTVAVIGTIGFPKGIGIIQELLALPAFRRLPVNIVIVGSSPQFPDGYRTGDGRFRVHGSYPREELAALLEEYGVSLVLIPSIWPETFSFTTAEALLLGYPVVCFDLGAQGERIRETGAGIVVEDVSARGLAASLEELLRHPDRLALLAERTARFRPLPPREHFDALAGIIAEGCREKETT